jgi:hypothetical protein
MRARAYRQMMSSGFSRSYVTKVGEESLGLGLGLPLSRRLARLLRGELRAVALSGKGGCQLRAQACSGGVIRLPSLPAARGSSPLQRAEEKAITTQQVTRPPNRDSSS